MPKFTVAIGSYNRRESLIRAVNAVFGQEFEEGFDLIIVLDASTDGSADAVSELLSRAPSNIRTTLISHSSNLGVGAVHNSSLEAARTPYIIFFDDDCIPAPDFVARYRDRWGQTTSDIVGIGGYVSAWETDTFNRRYLATSDPHRPIEQDYLIDPGFWERLALYFSPRRHSGFRPVFDVVGGNMSFRREALIIAGGFDSEVRLGGFERRACERLQKMFGQLCVYADPDLVIAHDYHPTLLETFARAVRVGTTMGRDFVWSRSLPSLRLGSITVLASVVLGSTINWPSAAGCFVIVTVLVFRRLVDLNKRESLAFPFIAFIEESLKNWGFVVGLWRFRHTRMDSTRG